MLDTIIGITGAFLLLLSFTLNQVHVWKDSDLTYDLVNLIGGTLLVIYGLFIHGYPFVVLNGMWAIVSLRDLILHFKKR
jgi:lipid-A-disaccharide synthase-like uncharacterized protein